MKHGCRITLVAAVADNGVIGADGGMPWRLRSDLRRFKALTLGKPVLMGRKTYQSIGRPLPGRANIVVGHKFAEAAGEVGWAASIDAGLELAAAHAIGAAAPEIMVIGGGAIYRAAWAFADRLCITHVHARPQGDTFFPAIDPGQWHGVERQEVPEGPDDSAATTFVVYDRIGSA